MTISNLTKPNFCQEWASAFLTHLLIFFMCIHKYNVSERIKILISIMKISSLTKPNFCQRWASVFLFHLLDFLCLDILLCKLFLAWL